MEDECFVIDASSKTHHWKGEGLCSIKTFLKGDAYYNIGKGHFRVDKNSFLLLNNKTEYEISIDSHIEINSFCIFFSSALLRDLNIELNASTSFLLDNFDYHDSELQFFERTYESGLLNAPLFSSFRRDFNVLRNDKLWLSQSYRQLLGLLPRINRQNKIDSFNLNYKKTNIQIEIYRRLLYAREYLHTNIFETPTIQQLSKVSTLSVNLLIRSFKQVFGQTPYQYFLDLKIEKAKELLGVENATVTAVASKLNIQSLTTFTNNFKKKTGQNPSAFLKKVILDKCHYY